MQDKAVIEELQNIEKERGVLNPKDVVDRARSAGSVLHGQFEWDNGEAAERYRLIQARNLIRICIKYVGPTKRKQQVFVSLTTDRHEGGGYRSLTSVLAMDNLKAQLLEDALLDMERFQSRYSHISELANVTEAMEVAKGKISSSKKPKRKAS